MPIICVHIMGGLGNQMFQYAMGRSLALATGRELVLDLSFFETQSLRRFELGPLNLPFRTIRRHELALANLTRRLIRHPAWWAVCQPLWPMHFKVDSDQGFNGELNRIRGPVYAEGYWQSPRYFKEHADQIKNDFALARPPDPRLGALLNEIEETNSVCVHVRRGDYVSDPTIARIHGACSPDYYREAFELVRGRTSPDKYFLFSDDPEWTQPNVVPPGPYELVSSSAGRGPLSDLCLMKACKHFIIANSTYSWWGAWLSANSDENKVVIAPKRWFADADLRLPDLIPQNWLQA